MLVTLGNANDDLQLHMQEDVCAALALQLSAKILTRPAHPGHRRSRARRGGCNSLRAIGTPIGIACTAASPLKGA